MSHPTRLLPLLALVSLTAFAADATPPPAITEGARGGRGFGRQTSSAPASDWIDPKTGHRVIRLSPDTGGSTLYFHDHRFTPEGDKMIIRGAGGVGIVDLSTLGKSPPAFEVVLPGVNPIATAWRTREAYFMQDGELKAVHLDTKEIRTVVKMPPEARGSAIINCDESLIVGIGPDPDGKTTPRLPPSGKLIPNPPPGSLEPNWAAGTPDNNEGDEDYAHLFWPGDGREPRWNDMPDITSSSLRRERNRDSISSMHLINGNARSSFTFTSPDESRT